MLRYVPAAIGLLLIIALGIVQGIWSDRWTDRAADARQVSERLVNVPLVVGDWEGTDQSDKADLRTLAVAGAVGHISYEFRNKLTGQNVSIYLVCGHAQTITLHTPDRCYPASGFTATSDQTLQPIEWDGQSVDFFTKSFRKESVGGSQALRVFWAWTTDGNWQAPEYPRYKFGGVRALFKLYLISPVETRGEQPHQSAALQFARSFMPALNKALFPNGVPAAAGAATAAEPTAGASPAPTGQPG